LTAKGPTDAAGGARHQDDAISKVHEFVFLRSAKIDPIHNTGSIVTFSPQPSISNTKVSAGFYTFVHKKGAQHRRKQFHLVSSGSVGRFVGSAEPTVLSTLRNRLGWQRTG
jgi:hypothetical protein